MKRNRKLKGFVALLIVMLFFTAIVGFAQGNKGDQGEGRGKTPGSYTVPEEEKKADGRAAQGEKEPGPPEIDTVTQASGNFYYEAQSLSGEELWAAIEDHSAATIVSTTNRDHSPNSSYVVPGFVEEGVLAFGLAPNQTKDNLLERDWAVIMVLMYDETIEAPYETSKYRGARIIVERISDEAEIERLMETHEGRPGTIYVRVVEVLPMG